MREEVAVLGQGEVLKLGGAASGEVTVIVDPRSANTPFVSGTRTLLRGETIPVQRHLRFDQVWFVHKGQGRAVVEAEAVTVVPGSVVSIPKGAWHGLRNTGTGVLQIMWTAAPPGLEAFYRELAQRGGVADPGGISEIAAHHGIEFRPDGGAAAPAVSAPRSGRRRRRRGGRGRGRAGDRQGASRQAQAPAEAPGAETTPQPSIPAPTASHLPPGPGQRQRHRRRRPAGSGQVPRSGSGSAPPAPKGRRPREGGRRRFGHVKEVYMGGRWIRVSGEGPVIAPGRERSRGPQEGVTKDDTPPGPLSVSL